MFEIKSISGVCLALAAETFSSSINCDPGQNIVYLCCIIFLQTLALICPITHHWIQSPNSPQNSPSQQNHFFPYFPVVGTTHRPDCSKISCDITKSSLTPRHQKLDLNHWHKGWMWLFGTKSWMWLIGTKDWILPIGTKGWIWLIGTKAEYESSAQMNEFDSSAQRLDVTHRQQRQHSTKGGFSSAAASNPLSCSLSPPQPTLSTHHHYHHQDLDHHLDRHLFITRLIIILTIIRLIIILTIIRLIIRLMMKPVLGSRLSHSQQCCPEPDIDNEEN